MLAPLALEARKRERVRARCSSLVDWPIYPRLSGTMWASKGAQCGKGRLLSIASAIFRQRGPERAHLVS